MYAQHLSQSFVRTSCRWILFGVLVLGLSMTSVTASSCSFLGLTVDQNATEVPMNLTGVVGVGLLRYDPDGEGCRALPAALKSLGFEQTTARIAIIVALTCGSLALLLTCVELLCCRFCGARILELSFLGTAAVAQACTFFLFGSGFWYVAHRYSCHSSNTHTHSRTDALFPCHDGMLSKQHWRSYALVSLFDSERSLFFGLSRCDLLPVYDPYLLYEKTEATFLGLQIARKGSARSMLLES